MWVAVGAAVRGRFVYPPPAGGGISGGPALRVGAILRLEGMPDSFAHPLPEPQLPTALGLSLGLREPFL
jgi:hypothetical protein